MSTYAAVIAIICLGFNPILSLGSPEAIHDCEHRHQIHLEQLPSASANYLNSQCRLNCSIGNVVIASDAINERLPCPLEPTGICHHGQCLGTQLQVLQECSHIHHLDLTKFNTTGSGYSDHLCRLTCIIDGKIASVNHLHEQLPCPAEPSGVCIKGRCTVSRDSTTTKPAPTPPNLRQFLIREVYLTILSADLATAQSNLSVAVVLSDLHGSHYSHRTHPSGVASSRTHTWREPLPPYTGAIADRLSIHLTLLSGEEKVGVASQRMLELFWANFPNKESFNDAMTQYEAQVELELKQNDQNDPGSAAIHVGYIYFKVHFRFTYVKTA